MARMEKEMKLFTEYLIEERSNYVKQERKRIEGVVKELAPQFDTFESFKKAALGSIENFNPNHFDLRWGYEAYNERQSVTETKQGERCKYCGLKRTKTTERESCHGRSYSTYGHSWRD